MRSKQFAIGACVAAGLSAAIVAGCGGGGSSTALPGPNPSPSAGRSPSPTPSPSVAPSPSPVASPMLQAAGMELATGGTVSGGFSYTPAPIGDIVVFSCGCFPVAGTAQVMANGAFSVVSPAMPTPAASPYVMVAGRNYVVVAQPLSGAGPQSWTFMFEGKGPSTTLGLGDTGSVLSSAALSDVYTTAASLYIYKQSTQCPAGGCNQAFDDWNFNAVETWLKQMKSAPNNAERGLLNDVAAQSAANASLFPKAPLWNPTEAVNPTIATDLNAVVGSDPSIPTPCPSGPSGCTGTPTP